MHPKPLTRRNSYGEIYVRTQEVESQIKEAMGLDPPTLIKRARNPDHTSPDFLKEECLVYMIREYLTLEDVRTTEQLFKFLFERIANATHQWLCSLDQDKAEDLCQDVWSKLINKIINLKSNKGDFLQVRFWVVLKRLISTAYKKQTEELVKERRHVPLYSPTSEKAEHTLMIDVEDNSIPPDEIVAYKEGLNILTKKQREIFVLRHYGGWPISSKDPDEETLSSRFGVSPRTVQNWLEEAKQALSAWKEGRRK